MNVRTPCALHSAQLSYNWGLWEERYDAACLKKCHVSIESFINSFDLIQKYIATWLC